MNELTSDSMSRFLPPLSRFRSSEFKPCAIYNPLLRTLSVYTENCSVVGKPITEFHETDILLKSHAEKGINTFCGFRLWVNPPFHLENHYKQKWGKYFPIFHRVYNTARLKIETRDVVSLVVRECPDMPRSWGVWKPYIDYTLNTYSLRVHIPLRFPN